MASAIIDLALPERREIATLYQTLLLQDGRPESAAARILLWNDLAGRVDAGDYSVFGKDSATSEVVVIRSLARANPDFLNDSVTIDGQTFSNVTFFHPASAALSPASPREKTARPGPKSSQDRMRRAAAELAASGRRFRSVKEEHAAVLAHLGEGEKRGYSYQTFVKAKAGQNL